VGNGKDLVLLMVNKATGTETNVPGINPGWKRHHPELEILVILKKRVIHIDRLNEKD
jgi:hypothetical protein